MKTGPKGLSVFLICTDLPPPPGGFKSKERGNPPVPAKGPGKAVGANRSISKREESEWERFRGPSP